MQWLLYMMCAGTGLTVGVLNGLFGAGGGIAAVMLLRKCGEYAEKHGLVPRDRAAGGAKAAHATSIALILPLSAFSAWLYLSQGSVSPGDAAVYIPGGIFGAAVGAFLLRRISPKRLRLVFAFFLLYTAFRLTFM